MEQEAEGIRAKGLAEAEAIEKKAEAQKKMGEASVLEMYLNALPEVVKNASAPLAQTDKIVMYGDGNATKVVRDVMNSANQIVDGLKESTGIDLGALLAGAAGGKLAAQAEAEKREELSLCLCRLRVFFYRRILIVPLFHGRLGAGAPSVRKAFPLIKTGSDKSWSVFSYQIL